MSALANFQNDDFQSLTIWTDDQGREFYRAIDACANLRHSNPGQALQRHVDPEYLIKIDDGTNRGGLTNYLSEPGLYQLIFASRTEWAKKFQKWVYDEVLPKLRAEGGYIMPTASSDQLVALQAQCEQQQKKILVLQSQNKSQAKRSEERRLLNVKRSDEARKAREERDRQKRRGDAYEAECKMWQRWVTNTQKTVDKMKKEFSKHQDANGKFQVDRIYQEMYSEITTRR